MSRKGISMRDDNDGLVVKVNLWPPRWNANTSASEARCYIKGIVTRSDGKRQMFNDPGKLLTIISQWNVEKLKELQAKDKEKSN
ncbi:MAG: hypothetical protein HY313_07505 [Acidobacteria bacterium]|nr:hypothetical protein [Acidobacteriota bacterium]